MHQRSAHLGDTIEELAGGRTAVGRQQWDHTLPALREKCRLRRESRLGVLGAVGYRIRRVDGVQGPEEGAELAAERRTAVLQRPARQHQMAYAVLRRLWDGYGQRELWGGPADTIDDCTRAHGEVDGSSYFLFAKTSERC